MAPAAFFRTRRHIHAATHVVYTSREFLEKRYPTQGQHTYCSNIALADFDDAIVARRRDKIRAKTGTTVIGSCGQIDLAFKGHKLVVEAIARLNKQGHDFRYELVGAGRPDYILAIAKQHGVEDRVAVLGKKRHADIFKWLDSIDVYVQPSLTEGLPRALVEAMSRAVPSIGTAIGGIPEFLDAHCMFEKKSVPALMETLKFVNAHALDISTEVYEKSKEYAADLIESRRRELFLGFKEWVESGMSSAQQQTARSP